MFENPSVRRVLAATVLCAALTVGPVHGQENAKKGGSVPITFVPPPMENATYSVGIYDVKTGKLARRLCEAAGQSAFKIGLNGLITSWDGKDDDGKGLPPGKYAARGYAVGPLKIEGEAIHGNDWAEDDDNLRLAMVGAIAVETEDDGLVVVGLNATGYVQVARYGGEQCKLLWQKFARNTPEKPTALPPVFSLHAPGDIYGWVGSHDFYLEASNGERWADRTPGEKRSSQTDGEKGKDDTIWKIEEGILSQYSTQGERLRNLVPGDKEPQPVAVAASQKTDRIYLLETAKGWQRVRGLSWVETKAENGKPVSTWQTFFERDIHAPDPSLGLEDAAIAKTASPTLEIPLEENPLSPGKHEHARLTATFDEKGSYLATADNLRLRQISQREHLRAVKLARGETVGGLAFFQTDGAAWDEFSVAGIRAITSFDAGEFEIDAAGEKPFAEKAPEPDL